MTTAPTGNCKLCNTTTTLEDSHIVPRWGFRRAVHDGPKPEIVHVRNGSASLNPDQLTEYLLCRQCERRIGQWEKYASEISRQLSGTFPALTLAEAQEPITRPAPNAEVFDLSRLKTEDIARFAASVIWRASVSSQPEFATVRLGSYAEDFRSYLLSDAEAFPSYARLVLYLIKQPTAPVDRLTTAPYSSTESGFHLHAFMMHGMHFKLLVGRSLPTDIDLLCFQKTGRAIVTDGEKALQEVGPLVLGAPPKGALARRYWKPGGHESRK